MGERTFGYVSTGSAENRRLQPGITESPHTQEDSCHSPLGLAQKPEPAYDSFMTRTLFKVLAWAALIAIAAATLSPIGLRPRLPVPVDLERSAAFLGLGLLFALAYPRRIWVALAIVLIGAFGLEWLQELRPDRHGRFDDALIKSIGAMIGLGAGWITVKLAETTLGRNSRA